MKKIVALTATLLAAGCASEETQVVEGGALVGAVVHNGAACADIDSFYRDAYVECSDDPTAAGKPIAVVEVPCVHLTPAALQKFRSICNLKDPELVAVQSHSPIQADQHETEKHGRTSATVGIGGQAGTTSAERNEDGDFAFAATGNHTSQVSRTPEERRITVTKGDVTYTISDRFGISSPTSTIP